MRYQEEPIHDKTGALMGLASLPVRDDGWWVYGQRTWKHQSWEFPFAVELAANTQQNWRGPNLRWHSGSAFAHFEQGEHEFVGMGTSPVLPTLPLFGFAVPQMPPLPMPKMPLPQTGRPDRPFPGIDAYFDEWRNRLVANNPPEYRFEFVGQRLVGANEEQVRDAEADARGRLQSDLAPISGRMFNYVVNAYLDRIVMREYLVRDGSGAPLQRLFMGAALHGYDVLYYPVSSGITAIPGGPKPLGQAERGRAEVYDVRWQVRFSFSGSCGMRNELVSDWGDVVAHFGLSAHLSDELEQNRAKREAAFRQQSSERMREDTQRLHQLNQELHEKNLRRQERLEWEMARSRERKLESDRRIRERWSAVNRGVDQYRGPHGELIEMPLGPIGSRAYYDEFSNTVFRTDGYVSGARELPRWEW